MERSSSEINTQAYGMYLIEQIVNIERRASKADAAAAH
jgi:hypothetical protein